MLRDTVSYGAGSPVVINGRMGAIESKMWKPKENLETSTLADSFER